MTDRDDSRPWTPPRPDRASVAWEDRAAGLGHVPTTDASDPSDELDDGLDEGHEGRAAPPIGARMRARWRRASRARRLATAATALVVATATVAVLGSAVQPRYATDEPTDGVVVDELRNRPATTSWTIGTRELGIPSADDGCLTYSVLGSIGSDVLVATSSQLASSETGCYDRQGRSERLVRLDPFAGDVRWSIDISGVSGGGGTLAAWIDAEAGDAIVSTTGLYGYGRGASGFGRVDLATGGLSDVHVAEGDRIRVVDANSRLVLTSESPAAPVTTGDVPGGDGAVVDDLEEDGDASAAALEAAAAAQEAAEAAASEGAATSEAADAAAAAAAEAALVDDDTGPRSTLYDRSDLDTPVWSGDGVYAGVTSEVLLDDGLLSVGQGVATLVDGRTGEGDPWADDLPLDAQGYRVDDTVYLVSYGSGMDSPAELSARSLDGAERWRREFEQDRWPAVTGDCVVFSDRAGVRCVDEATGVERWSRARSTETRGLPIVGERQPGQWGDDVFLQTFEGRSAPVVPGGDRALLVLDAVDGSERARAFISRESTLVGASRSVGYAAVVRSADSFDGQVVFRDVTAVDLSDGRRLWHLQSESDLQFWGGALVSIAEDGSIRRLVDTVRVTR